MKNKTNNSTKVKNCHDKSSNEANETKSNKNSNKNSNKSNNRNSNQKAEAYTNKSEY